MCFRGEGETPNFVCRSLKAEVAFVFSGERSYTSDEALLTVMDDPAKARAVEGLPYHVDVAHAQLLAGLSKGARILEIGCGGGQTRSWYQKEGHFYVGTDISEDRVQGWLRKNGGADLLCDAHFLPFQDECFDVVYSAAVFEHLACPIRAMQEVMRVLKPNGLFLANASFMEPWHDHSYFHLSPLGALELLTAANFKVEAIWPSRRYSGFKAMFGMAYHRLNPLRLMGSFFHALYGLQIRGLSLARTALGQTAHAAILERATVAGATDWIARKPGC